MKIDVRRIYDDDSSTGYRVLVDRLWPRGISKEDAALDDWWKDTAPSDELRDWFGHDPDKWGEVRRKYLHELKGHKDTIKQALAGVSGSHLVLLYGAKDERHNNARVLKEYLERLG